MSKSFILDAAAVVISVSALGVSINQANEAKKTGSASIMPHLDMTLIGGAGTQEEKGIRLDNAGPGIALIDDFNLYVDGELIEGRKQDVWGLAMQKLRFSSVEINDFRTVFLTGADALKSGREIYLIRPNLDGQGNIRTLTNTEWNKLRRLTVKIDYRGA